MMENQDTVEGAEGTDIETPKASRGGLWGGVSTPQPTTVFGERSPGWSSGQKWIWCILGSKERIMTD